MGLGSSSGVSLLSEFSSAVSHVASGVGVSARMWVVKLCVRRGLHCGVWGTGGWPPLSRASCTLHDTWVQIHVVLGQAQSLGLYVCREVNSVRCMLRRPGYRIQHGE